MKQAVDHFGKDKTQGQRTPWGYWRYCVDVSEFERVSFLGL